MNTQTFVLVFIGLATVLLGESCHGDHTTECVVKGGLKTYSQPFPSFQGRGMRTLGGALSLMCCLISFTFLDEMQHF
jgi:hypothetical protein